MSESKMIPTKTQFDLCQERCEMDCGDAEKMSGLKQKAKEPFRAKGRPITSGKLSIICANCELDRTKEKTPLETHCPRCGFNPSFNNIIVNRLADTEEEVAKLTKQLEKVAWYCIDCEEWHAKGVICAVHEVRKVRNGRGRNDY